MAPRASKTEDLIAARLQRARQRRRRAWWCVPALCLVGVGAVVAHTDTIAQDLAARSRAAVAAAGYANVEIAFEGREATVRGSVADPVDQLAVEALIEKQTGVRWADLSALEVTGAPAVAPQTAPTRVPASMARSALPSAAPVSRAPVSTAPPPKASASEAPVPVARPSEAPAREAPASAAPSSEAVVAEVTPNPAAIRLHSTPDGLVLTGQLSSEAGQAALRTAIVEALSDVAWTDKTQVVEGDAQPWLREVIDVIPQLGVVENLRFSIDPHVLRVGGQLSAPQARKRLEAALQSAAPRHVVQNRIELIPPAAHVRLRMKAAAGLDLFFGPDGVHLTDDGIAELRRITPILQRTAGAIAVEAHTDAVGEAALNQNRSTRRADAVQAFLIEQGVGAERLTARGFGESKPIADNETPAGRALNRRIVIRLAE